MVSVMAFVDVTTELAEPSANTQPCNPMVKTWVFIVPVSFTILLILKVTI
jgi:hypothetical protein